MNRAQKIQTICFVSTVALLVFGTTIYWRYWQSALGGTSGGSSTGIIFGAVGSAMILIAIALAVRKQFPRRKTRRFRRVGAVQTWMQFHLWLGFLSYPFILFHSGFRFGHGLTFYLMLILSGVVGSGLLGTLLQHFVPHFMMKAVPYESIYDNIDQVRRGLLEKAKKVLQQSGGKETQEEQSAVALAAASGSTATSRAPTIAVARDSAGELHKIYQSIIEPYLEKRDCYWHELYNARTAREKFVEWRDTMPTQIHQPLEDLEDICWEKRDLDRQSRIHFWLHSWLVVHVPLSFLLIVLGTIHAIVALRYGG